MKRACWTLFAVSVVLFLAAVYSKLLGPDHFVFGYTAISWWRSAMALAIYAMALKIVAQDGRVVA
jgi:hypothetical protein